MKDTTLRALVAEAVSLDRQKSEIENRLKEIKADLLCEADTRRDEHTPTDGGGSSWTAEGNDGCIARVTFPGAKLKSSIPGVGAAIQKIQQAAGRAFGLLFSQIPAWKPCEDFRHRAAELLGPREAKKLIKLCETASSPTISYETKDAQ